MHIFLYLVLIYYISKSFLTSNFTQPFVCARVSVHMCMLRASIDTFNSCDYWMSFS